MNNSIVKSLLAMCIILSAGILPTPIQAADKIILVGTEGVKNSMYGEWLTVVFTEVFRRLGYELQYDGYPAARASALSDAGKVDGEISRVYEYQEAHPDLIRIEEVLYSTNFVAFAARPGIFLHGWGSLQNTTYKVEYRIGVKLSASKLRNVVAPRYLSYVTTAEQGLKKLLLGRTDVYVDVAFTIRESIKRLDSPQYDADVLYQAGIMQKVDAYAFMHKKHVALVPKVVEVLKAMKQEGSFGIGIGPR